MYIVGLNDRPAIFGHLTQRHVHRPIVAFDRKDFIPRQVHIFIAIVDRLSHGKEFHPELRARLLPLVDNPPLPAYRLYEYPHG